MDTCLNELPVHLPSIILDNVFANLGLILYHPKGLSAVVKACSVPTKVGQPQERLKKAVAGLALGQLILIIFFEDF